jgi:hypothetical protein
VILLRLIVEVQHVEKIIASLELIPPDSHSRMGYNMIPTLVMSGDFDVDNLDFANLDVDNLDFELVTFYMLDFR